MPTTLKNIILVIGLSVVAISLVAQGNQPTEAQLERLLMRFPEADANGDGKLSIEEARAYQREIRTARASRDNRRGQTSGQNISFHPGWETGSFPDYAVSKKSPDEIMEIYKSGPKARSAPAPENALGFPKPEDGALRIVGVGHSFMVPAYKALPLITEAAGFDQPMSLHTGGGATGSARYKWEQENGIYQFDGKPVPKLLAAISNYEWEAMLWGAYFNDRPEFYTCWIDFCLKYNPGMKFYLMDAWPQLYQLESLFGMSTLPETEDFFTEKVLQKMGSEKNKSFYSLLETVRSETTGNVFIIPTNDAFTEAAKLFIVGNLPGVDGLYKAVGGQERSIWRDRLGHIGPGFERLEGYVFYATLYGKSPELISENISFPDESGYPGKELDRIFRKIAWKAVVNHPYSGVADKNGNLIGDHLE